MNSSQKTLPFKLEQPKYVCFKIISIIIIYYYFHLLKKIGLKLLLDLNLKIKIKRVHQKYTMCQLDMYKIKFHME